MVAKGKKSESVTNKNVQKPKRYRSAETGQFVSKEFAKEHKKTTVSEEIKK